MGEFACETWEAPINIAVVKYWGKRDCGLMLPLNGSLSVTVSTSAMRTVTTVAVSRQFERDVLWLNGRECPMDSPFPSKCDPDSPWARFERCLDAIRQRSSAPWRDWRVHACSRNNFPTRAGVASSASGFACLVSAAASVFRVTGDINGIARLGSGSACRSVHGGFVLWERGVDDIAGTDSIARQLFAESHWPELRLVFLFAELGEKKVGSTDGMQRSVETSALLKERVRGVPETLRRLEGAIARRDFGELGAIAMRDSNQMHAVCLDTYPPIAYLRDVSHAVIRAVTELNAKSGRTVAAYTFDAGPNPVVFVLEGDLETLFSALVGPFPSIGSADGATACPQLMSAVSSRPSSPCEECGRISRVLVAKVGCGPRRLGDSESLIDPNTGMPIHQ